jgi:hypothetical protein
LKKHLLSFDSHRHAGKVLRGKNVCHGFLRPRAHGLAAHLTLPHADNAGRMNGERRSRLASVRSLPPSLPPSASGGPHAERAGVPLHDAPDTSRPGRRPSPSRCGGTGPSHHQTKGRRRQRRTPTRPRRDARRINSAVERSPPARRSAATASRCGDELTRCRTARADVH